MKIVCITSCFESKRLKGLRDTKVLLHHIQSGGLRQDVEDLISRLDSLDTVLQGGEYVAGGKLAEKIADAREKLGEVKDVISKPLDYYDALDEIWTFVGDIGDLSKFEPGQDTLNEAKAYGKAIKSLSKVAGRIPLLNIYASALEMIGDYFADIVTNIVPHLRGRERRMLEPVIQNDGFDPMAPL